MGLPAPTGMDDADASMLQEAAARVVFDETDSCADAHGNAPKKSGCATVTHAGGIAVVLVTLLGRTRRETADR